MPVRLALVDQKPAFGASTSGPIVASISPMLNGILTRDCQRRIPAVALLAMRRHGIASTRFLLTVSVAKQQVSLFELKRTVCPRSQYEFRRSFVVSTSSYGTGQVMNSQQTPLGL